jgi:hypothetical protein
MTIERRTFVVQTAVPIPAFRLDNILAVVKSLLLGRADVPAALRSLEFQANGSLNHPVFRRDDDPLKSV